MIKSSLHGKSNIPARPKRSAPRLSNCLDQLSKALWGHVPIWFLWHRFFPLPFLTPLPSPLPLPLFFLRGWGNYHKACACAKAEADHKQIFYKELLSLWRSTRIQSKRCVRPLMQRRSAVALQERRCELKLWMILQALLFDVLVCRNNLTWFGIDRSLIPCLSFTFFHISQGTAVLVRRPNYLEEMDEKLVNAHAFLGGLD